MNTRFELVDIKITRWMASRGLQLLRISLGAIFFWFGMLKFFEGLSPAEALATQIFSELDEHAPKAAEQPRIVIDKQ